MHLTNHQLQFYDNETTLCDRVGAYLLEGLAEHQALLIVSTPGHTAGFLDRMRLGGVNPEALLSARRLVIADARATLNQIMIDGWPDEGRFRATVGVVVDALKRHHPDTTVRIYGEMVSLLAADGRVDAAIRLEDLWCGLLAEPHLCLLCGYDLAGLDVAATATQFEAICARHGEGTMSRLAMVASEFRTPLSSIQRALHAVRDESSGAEARRRAVEAIGQEVRQMASLVHELLDLTNVETVNASPSAALVDGARRP